MQVICDENLWLASWPQRLLKVQDLKSLYGSALAPSSWEPLRQESQVEEEANAHAEATENNKDEAEVQVNQ